MLAITQRRWSWRCWLVVPLLFLSPIVFSNEPTAEFDLPEQSLAQSIADVSRQVGQPVLFKPEALRGRKAPALRGSLTTGEALRRLLADTPLAAEASGSGWLIKQRPEPAAPPSPPDRDLDEVLVVGQYTQSLDQARRLKRWADRQQDVILAEGIGEFPALNVAEAIKRSPGVSVVRDRGEALFLSIRGLPTQFNTLTLNGEPVATHENARTSEQYGRRFHYDTLPAELIAGLQVRKSTQARDPAGAIGGSVNLRTYQPLSLESPTLTLGTNASYSDLADHSDPQLHLIKAWRNERESFGLLLGATYGERHLRQDRALNFRWAELDDDTHRLTPGSVRPTLEQEARQSAGLNGALQWRPGERTELSLNWLGLRQQMDYREYSYSADYEPEQLEPGSLDTRNGALIAGRTLTGSSQIGTESTRLTDQFQASQLRLQHKTDHWETEISLTHSGARSHNDEPIRRTRLRREGEVDFRFRYFDKERKRLPDIQFLNGLPSAGDAYPGRRLEWRTILAEDDLTGGRGLARKTLQSDFADSLEVGVQWRRHRRDYQRRDALIEGSIKGAYFPSNYFQSLPINDFLSGQAGNLPRTWSVPDQTRFWQSVDTEALSGGEPSEQDRLNSYRVRETVSALYAQLAWDRQTWRGNLGLRYAHTGRETAGHQWQPDTDTAMPVLEAHHYDHWLPALNLVYNADENQLWRLSLARTLNHPDLQDLAPRLTANSGDITTAVGGNPALEPVTAWQADLAWEWYFNPRSLLSTGVFYTGLDDFIQTDITTLAIGDEWYEVTTKSNGARARVAGLELDYQQTFPLPRGELGIQFNLALTDSVANYRIDGAVVRDDLAEVSGQTLNVGLSYETGRFGARAHYNWRGEVLEEVGAYTLAAQNSEPFGSLDSQIAFSVSDSVTLTLEGVNLTGAAEWESVSNNEFAGFTYYGRTYRLGLKAQW